jgi:hypothetical protein
MGTRRSRWMARRKTIPRVDRTFLGDKRSRQASRDFSCRSAVSLRHLRVGAISLVTLAAAFFALYMRRLSGAWKSSEELVTDFLTSPPILRKWQRDHGSRNIATNNAMTTSQLTVSKLSTMPMIIITLKLRFSTLSPNSPCLNWDRA